MKVLLLMTISADRYIARLNDEAPWSPEEFVRCNEFIQQAGNVIVGHKTYEIMKATGDQGKVHFVSTPKEALDYVQAKNFQTAVISGGTATNTAFLDAGLIDEIILDIEPIIFGEGLPLFSQKSREGNMQLLGVEKLDKNAVRLRYSVIREVH
jgi:dihydrofolate reductase